FSYILSFPTRRSSDLIFIIMTVLVYILMHKSRFGRYVYALGSNEKATLLSGIRIDRIKIGVYSLAGLLVGVAAIIETSRLNSIRSEEHTSELQSRFDL